MLSVHTKDGLTSSFDLEDEEQVKQWLSLLRNPDFHLAVTGLTITHRGIQYSLPRPKGFRQLRYMAESVPPDFDRRLKGGERIFCFADTVRVAAMVHREQPAAVRISLTKTGRQRFSPWSK